MNGPESISRRRILATGVRLALAWPLAASVGAGCGGSGEEAERGAAGGAGSTGGQDPAAQPTPPAAPAQPAPPAQDAAGADAPAPEDALVTDVAASASLVAALQYTHESPKPDQRCENCLLYTAGSGGRGRCQLFAEGLVKASGWCASWAAKG